MTAKAEILAQLQRDILALQGFRPAPAPAADGMGLGPINRAFPNAVFPLKGVHEFCCPGAESASASSGFVAGLLSSVMPAGKLCLWIGGARRLFPPALKLFGIDPHRVIFVQLRNEKQVLWAVEEALKCPALAAVVGEVRDLGFTESRRLQLAVEGSGVACFVMRRNPSATSTAAVTRWQVTPLPSRPDHNLPGVGYPRWQVSLLKVRNGKSGTWELEWRNGRFRHPSKLAAIGGGVQKQAV